VTQILRPRRFQFDFPFRQRMLALSDESPSACDRLDAMAADRVPTTILRQVRRRNFAPASACGRGTVARWRRRRTQTISQAGNAASRPNTGVQNQLPPHHHPPPHSRGRPSVSSSNSTTPRLSP
jgi:hypothetical protein